MCYPEALPNLNSDTVMLNEEHGPISTLMYVYTANVQALSGEGGDQWVERDTDTGSIPGAAFFSQSQLSVQPQCALACIKICAHVKSPKHWQPYHCLDTRKH